MDLNWLERFGVCRGGESAALLFLTSNPLGEDDPRVAGAKANAVIFNSRALERPRATAQIEQLALALRSSNASEVEMLAHRCKGASATCGINALVHPMARLERAARSGDLSNAADLLAETKEAFGRVEEILSERIKSLVAAGKVESSSDGAG